jgi:hypothetical protein
VDANGGSVKTKYNSIIMRVCTAGLWHSYVPACPACLIICDQGFAAEIPDAYLLALQTNLQQSDSDIAYIGKAYAIR